jgi:cell wall-associated NlpC family hydrolase
MLLRMPEWPCLLKILAYAGACGALAVVAPDVAASEAVVLTTAENMYSRPDENADVVSQALLGQSVKLLATQGAFAEVETPDAYRGWLPERALRRYPRADSPRYASQGQVAEITSLIANVYRDPNVTSARPKTQATLGVRLELASAEAREGFLAVRLPAGDAGFVHAGDARLLSATAAPARVSRAELVATARRFIGLPYLWGGMSPLGLDCSGLVSQVYRSAGRILPRDADLQFVDARATPVERAGLQPGDLVFFGRTKITHVGLYAGAGRFVHATTHGSPRVQESALDEPYWTGLYRGARRPAF